MDQGRVRALWEYAVQGMTVEESGVLQFCSMYLGKPIDKDLNEKLRSVISETLSAAASKASQDVLSSILQPNSALEKFLVENAPREKKPQDSLRTILDENLAEEDEDDSSVDENEEEEEKREGLRILMRGFLKRKENVLEWSGNWALSTEAFDSGDKAKFRYEMKGDSSQIEKDGRIMIMPLTTLFDGSFLVKEPTAPNGFIRMDEQSVKFDFSPVTGAELKWKVTGKGQNTNGDFTIEGELDGTTRRMAVFKTYMYKKADNSSDDGSSIDADEEEEAFDPTELEDLKADQLQSYGRVLVGTDADDKIDDKTTPKKKKLRRIEE